MKRKQQCCHKCAILQQGYQMYNIAVANVTTVISHYQHRRVTYNTKYHPKYHLINDITL